MLEHRQAAMKTPSPADATILLLDSDPLMRAALRDALESTGYLVVSVADLGSAVDRLQEMRPDLLIMCPYINSMPGHMAADYLRTKRHGLPVLIVGGFMDDDRVRDQNAISMYHIFPKPFHRSDLLASVRDVLSTVRKS
jgi:DNA-binding response OmpR family regulator